ncbi:uncharacterized protein LOC107219364 isoform X2 [Neodiprion lecontei]|uniref:Uncharacterized protein LOC107219364 isoform X2 n=1 Tax=Neodiprion lecontei TaxID=441921 RepID=A0A6J0BFU0_NEOLC|nr:uncharacterized protein LOC107219364 isoform X2 [Neodiprion lecontei]
MENILRLGVQGNNSFIPTPRSGKYGSNDQKQIKNDYSKITKTEQNKLRLIMQYGEHPRDGNSLLLVDTDAAVDKEENTTDLCNAVRAKTNQSNTRIPVHSIDSRSPRSDFDKARSKRGVAQGVKEEEEEEEFPRGKNPGRLTEAVLSLGGVGTLDSAKRTALSATRGSDAPSTTHPAVATPDQQQQQQQRFPESGEFPQSQQRRTQRTTTRCAPGSAASQVARYKRPETTATPGAKVNKEDVMEPELKEKDERKSSTPSPELPAHCGKPYNEDGSSEEDGGPSGCSRTHRLSSLYHGTWPVERGLWNSQQTGLGNQQSTSTTVHNDIASVMSFSSSVSMGVGCPGGAQEMQGQRRLGAKVDVVYSLLGMLGGAEGREDMSATLLSMSNSTDSCLAMRQSGCLPLLVQLIHAPGQDPETRDRASQAIHNIVHSRGEERAGRREARVLRLLEQLRDYCQSLRTTLAARQPLDDFDRHPGPTIAALMKLSFDEAHRHAMCQLGGLHAVAELIEMDHAAHGSECDDQNCVTLRRYAGMALTNLTFGDGNNKALLCSFREFMKALVAQLRSPSDDLRQVTASVLRNLSWRADSSSKQTLREVGAVVGLTMAAMEGRKESTLKSILSALWNLSAHCSTNKIDICAVEGALAFLVDMLSYKAPSKTLAIVENAGGILRNVSSHVAVREDYRSILRERGCLQVLLRQLRSPSLTVVSNACGALWNLSARCPQDQRMLWDLGAVPMLRSLVHSKHKMISMGSSAALKNLLGARPGSSNLVHLDSTARGLGLPTLPTLVARRQKALEQEIDQNLAETCDNIEPSTSPTNKDDKFGFKVERRYADLDSRSGHSYQMQNGQPGPSSMRFNCVARSESRESVRSITSTHSDTIFERVNRHVLNGVSPTESQAKQQSSSLHAATGFNTGISADSTAKVANSDRKYVLRYKNAFPERQRAVNELSFNDVADLRCTTSTMSWASAADQEAACSQILMRSSIDESSLSNELNNPLIANSDDIKSQYFSEGSGLSSITRSGASLPVTSSQQVDECVHYGNENREIMGAIKKDTTVSKPVDYRLRYTLRDVDQDEKQHSGYFVESEEEFPHSSNIKNPCAEERTQYKTSGLKVCREFNGKDNTVTSTTYESWKSEPSKGLKHSSETSSLNSLDKHANYRLDQASNSSSSISSLTGTVVGDKSAASITQKPSNALEESNNNSMVEAKNDISTLDSVSDVDRSHKFTDHQQEQTSLTFPQYDSLGLLSGFDEHSSLASNSSLRLESFTGNEFLESPAESMSVNNLQPVCTSNMQNQESTLSDQHLSHAESYSVMHNTFVNDVTPNGLTIDDEPKIANDSRLKEYSAISAAGISESDEIGESLNLGIGSILEDREEDTEVNEVDNGSDHLFADVTSEAEAARHKTPFRRNSLQKSPQPVSNLTRYQTSSALDQVDVTGPVSLITETQNFRHSTHDATGGPASLTMETLNFRHPAHDANDTFMGDTENPTREISRIPSLVTELPRCSSAGLEDISNVLEQDAGSNKLDICRNTTKPAFTLSALENEELDLTVENVSDKQESILDVAAKFFVEKIAENVSETTCRPAPSTSGNRVSPEPTTTLQEENVVENQSEDQHVENASTDIPHLIPKNILSENENTTSKIFFDYRVGSENSTNGEGVEEKNSMKLTEYSPGISPSKIEDDIENMNNSEEDNLSDEVTSPTIDPLFSAVERAACNKGDRSKNREETEEEYRRQRDPDAMIASLDRLTATLVQQTEAMRERDSSAMKQSVVSDTWNEDSPNDVSFPSISVSAPLIASFKSDNQEDQTIPNPEYSDELIGTQEVMTDSRIIEQEANKLAAAVNARVAEFDLDAVSMTSMDLDAIKPPSTMGSLVSLTTSLIGPIDTTEHSIVRERCHSASLPPLQLKSQISIDCRNGRKKSLPAGVMAKRALSQYQNHTGSLENLLSETGTTSMSHLENVKPPSMMDELLDAMDMENSMLSVASITSEVADTKDQDSHSLTSSDPIFDLLKPVANILSMTCMRYAESMQVSGNNSLSECLENINPPSLFNEVSEMDESTMEPTSETFCSDTLCIDNELQTEEVCRDREISIDRIEECDNDTDDAATSIPSEYCVSSSAESTPKKWHNKSNLTPKQKRQLAKERYKTYTIAAEMVKKEEEERRKNDHEESKIGKYARGKCSPFSKLTPKQRRQEDRARFQTQVLNNPFPELVAYNATECQTPLADNPESPETEEASSAVKSCIPTLRKLSGGKTIKQKRAENKDRYRTRTLDDEEAQEASKDVDAVISGTHFGDSDASLETMLLITPGEMKTKLEDFVGQGSSSGKPIGEDVLTVSKAQNLTLDDFESEYDSRVRVADGLHKRFGKSQLSEPTAVLSFTSRFNEQKQLSPSKDSLQDLASPAEPESQGNSDSNNESDEESNSANNQSQIPKRPRIVKPGTISRDASVDSNATDKSESESPKTIRGRRKALYFKPTTRKSTPTTSPSKIHNGAVSGIPIGRSNTSPLVRGTRATTLRQTHNPSFPTKHQQKSVANSKIISPSACAVEKRIQGSALTANKTSIPQRGTVFNYSKSTKRHTTPLGSSSASYAFKDDRKEPAIKPLERQGTFTKEEPEVENAPTVLPPCSPNRSKIAKPIKTSPSKIQTPSKSKPITKILQTQQSKFTKANNLDKDQARNSSPTVTYQKRSLIGSPIKNSPSNQSLQSNESARTTKKTNCLGQRSNSNSSIVSNSSTGIQGRRTSKEATSKIASLWKRVEESKTKQRFEKNDTRHWITPANDTIESGNPVVTTKPPTFRLIRSSTFEGVPKDISRNGSPGRPKSNVAKQPAKVTDTQGLSPKYRNSCDLTGMSIAEAHCKIPVKYPELSAGTRNTIQIDDSTVILRKPQTTQPSVDPVEVDPTKRVSRLGSFIRVEPPETEGGNTQMQTYVNSVRTPASAIVPPFNYNPKQSNPVKANISEIDGKLVVTECQMEITTSSMRVTTV